MYCTSFLDLSINVWCSPLAGKPYKVTAETVKFNSDYVIDTTRHIKWFVVCYQNYIIPRLATIFILHTAGSGVSIAKLYILYVIRWRSDLLKSSCILLKAIMDSIRFSTR